MSAIIKLLTRGHCQYSTAGRRWLSSSINSGTMNGIIKHNYKGPVLGAVVRRATHEDYEGVMDIGKNVFDGLDYLPFQYHSYIDNPRRRCYVCFKDSEIVGFEMLLIVDDGQTAVSQAGRVKRNARGLGISSYLIEFALQDNQRNAPITSLLWTTWNEKETRKLLAWNKQLHCTEYTKFNMQMLSSGLDQITRSRDFERVLTDFSVHRVRLLNSTQTHEAMSSISIATDFLPAGVWYVKNEPLGTLPSNFTIVTHEFNSNVLTMSKAGERVNDISFGSVYKCTNGFHFIVDFYVDKKLPDGQKSTILVSHVLKHLVLLNQNKRNAFISIRIDVQDKTTSFGELKNVLLQELTLHKMDQWSCSEKPQFIIQSPVSGTKAKL